MGATAASPDDPDGAGPTTREPVPAGVNLAGGARRPPPAGPPRRAVGRKPGRRGRPSGKKRR
ncbi:hypothetical protein FAGKG844_370016 [Frankia sp. AgKG'84/4]